MNARCNSASTSVTGGIVFLCCVFLKLVLFMVVCCWVWRCETFPLLGEIAPRGLR